jgi:retron-type reverse transcriptase
MERREPTAEARGTSQPQHREEQVHRAKPFAISKQEVWQAYQKVKANRGAAGVDGQTIEEFERDLKMNLYKLWNRMSSGSYFPPPVLRVEIPKSTGGMRPLGIPTLSVSRPPVRHTSGI